MPFFSRRRIPSPETEDAVQKLYKEVTNYLLESRFDDRLDFFRLDCHKHSLPSKYQPNPLDAGKYDQQDVVKVRATKTQFENYLRHIAEQDNTIRSIQMQIAFLLASIDDPDLIETDLTETAKQGHIASALASKGFDLSQGKRSAPAVFLAYRTATAQSEIMTGWSRAKSESIAKFRSLIEKILNERGAELVKVAIFTLNLTLQAYSPEVVQDKNFTLHKRGIDLELDSTNFQDWVCKGYLDKGFLLYEHTKTNQIIAINPYKHKASTGNHITWDDILEFCTDDMFLNKQIVEKAMLSVAAVEGYVLITELLSKLVNGDETNPDQLAKTLEKFKLYISDPTSFASYTYEKDIDVQNISGRDILSYIQYTLQLADEETRRKVLQMIYDDRRFQPNSGPRVNREILQISDTTLLIRPSFGLASSEQEKADEYNPAFVLQSPEPATLPKAVTAVPYQNIAETRWLKHNLVPIQEEEPYQLHSVKGIPIEEHSNDLIIRPYIPSEGLIVRRIKVFYMSNTQSMAKVYLSPARDYVLYRGIPGGNYVIKLTEAGVARLGNDTSALHTEIELTQPKRIEQHTSIFPEDIEVEQERVGELVGILEALSLHNLAIKLKNLLINSETLSLHRLATTIAYNLQSGDTEDIARKLRIDESSYQAIAATCPELAEALANSGLNKKGQLLANCNVIAAFILFFKNNLHDRYRLLLQTAINSNSKLEPERVEYCHPHANLILYNANDPSEHLVVDYTPYLGGLRAPSSANELNIQRGLTKLIAEFDVILSRINSDTKYTKPDNNILTKIKIEEALAGNRPYALSIVNRIALVFDLLNTEEGIPPNYDEFVEPLFSEHTFEMLDLIIAQNSQDEVSRNKRAAAAEYLGVNNYAAGLLKQFLLHMQSYLER